jgi:hypothetical protein
LSLFTAVQSDAALDVIKMIYEAYPEAIKVTNNDGDLLYSSLHYALKLTGIIRLVFEAYYEAAKEKDEHGNMPLHIALCYHYSLVVIMMIFEAHRGAVEVHNNDGELH